jgi:lipoprotein NlpD
MSIRQFSLILALALTACGTGNQRVAVVDRTEAAKPSAPVLSSSTPKKTVAANSDWRPSVHVVKKGDTMYSIAFNYGLDYRELAELNGIENPSIIKIGQEIRLFPQGKGTQAKAGDDAAVPVEPVKRPAEIPLKTTPKAIKLPYSEQALAQLEAMPDWNKPVVAAPVTQAKQAAEAKPEAAAVKPLPPPVIVTPVVPVPKAEVAKAETEPVADDAAAGEELVWIAPTSGKVIGEFSESANRKGVDIAGKVGQPVYASAGGKVVYSGSGLRGYGKLIIIKHNKTYISAYAHNDKILVKERQQVTKGDKIAEMGNTDSEQVKLHFEIRKFGKPIDPSKLLPPIKP